jgi:hypothetical protein
MLSIAESNQLAVSLIKFNAIIDLILISLIRHKFNTIYIKNHPFLLLIHTQDRLKTV